MRKSFLLTAIAAVLFVSSPLDAQVIDGDRTSAGDNYGPAISVQTVQTQFGDANPNGGSELDAVYAYNDATNLYLMFTGNLESNFNKFNCFIDSVAGGENVLTADFNSGGNNPDNDGWANRHAGMTFDSGFEADFLLIARNGNFGGDKFDLDFNSVGSNTVFESTFDVFGGTLEGSDGMLANGIKVGFNNSNVDGIMGGTEAADQAAALLVETGLEFQIPLAAIGAAPGDTIRVCAFINGSNHDFISNQFMAGLEAPQSNLGGNISMIDLNTFNGSQFFSIALTTPGPVTVPPAAFSVIRGTFNAGGLPELEFSDNMDLSIFRSTTDIQSRTQFEVTATSPTATPSSFDVTLEGSVFARSQVNQTIELFDYDAGAFETVDTRPATRFSDSTVTISPAGDLSRFVDSSTNEITARVRYQSVNPRQQFTSNTDQFVWDIE